MSALRSSSSLATAAAVAAAAAAAAMAAVWVRSRRSSSAGGAATGGSGAGGGAGADDDDDAHAHLAAPHTNAEFERAAAFVRSGLLGDANVSQAVQLELYGLFKVATAGPNVAARPGAWDFEGRAKWEAWCVASGQAPPPVAESASAAAAAKANLSPAAPGWVPPASRAEAAARYVARLDLLLPTWREYQAAADEADQVEAVVAGGSRPGSEFGTGMGQSVSVMARPPPEDDDDDSSDEEEGGGGGDASAAAAAAAAAGGGGARSAKADARAARTAAQEGDCEALGALLEPEGSVSASWSDARSGDSLLHMAADGCHVDVVRLLIDRGAAVDARDSDGMTALHYAGLQENADIASALLAAGADPEAEDSEGEKPQLPAGTVVPPKKQESEENEEEEEE